DFLRQFPSIRDPRLGLDPPGDPATFRRCILDWSERERHGEVLALHRDLLRLRREDPVFRAQDGTRLDGALLSPHAFLVRFFGEAGDDRLLLVNLGPDLELGPVPEPLFAPPAGTRWALRWSSEWPQYGGGGMADPPRDGVWVLPAACAAVLGAER
ncbi:MAG TPA: DUF3459 domain-containing protein, partial [Planctomycetota bacterium]|nr:DUF3459 domain-containing protein [Planctomycetota bacterium]